MRTLAIAAGSLFLLAAAAMWSLGETVTLRTLDAGGYSQETRLWIVEHDGAVWLRSARDHGWFQRLESHADVELRRGGRWLSLRAAVSESESDREIVNRLMREKYGVADTLIGGVFDHSMPVVVRLEPR